MADLSLDVNTTDPEALAKVFEQIESGQDLQTSDNKPVENPQDETAGTSNKEQQAEQGQTDQSNEAEEAAGIATKDGKHVIPYSVLKSERERATRAEQLAQEMKERVEALEAMVKSGNQGAKDGESARTDQQTPAADQLSKEDLESLKEDFPTVYKAVMASMAKAQALEAKLQPVEELGPEAGAHPGQQSRSVRACQGVRRQSACPKRLGRSQPCRAISEGLRDGGSRDRSNRDSGSQADFTTECRRSTEGGDRQGQQRIQARCPDVVVRVPGRSGASHG